MANEIIWKYPEAIRDCQWLIDNLSSPDIRIFDCTTYLHYTDDDPKKPYDVESGFNDYIKSHIPNAALIDLQRDLSENDSSYKFTIPQMPDLIDRLKQLGIGHPYHIVLYARNGLQWATRVWWIIRSAGFQNVSVLDGGFTEWCHLGLPVETGENWFSPAQFEPEEPLTLFVGKKSVLEGIKNENSVLINALTSDIHSGQSTRYGRPGHIPTSQNIPFHEFLDHDSGKLKSPSEAQAILGENEINADALILNYCGGGIAATLNAFVMMQLGYQHLEIYDNSMSEWAMDERLPIATCPVTS